MTSDGSSVPLPSRPAGDQTVRALTQSLGAAHAQAIGDVVAHKGADHVHVAVREVNQLQHAVNHCVAQRDERINRAERDAVD